MKTHCIAGHPLSGDNLYVRPTGIRSCRACARRRQQDLREENRQYDGYRGQRQISVRGDTYRRLQAVAHNEGTSISALVERAVESLP